MKKKVLYGVAVALFASVAMGSLQSCKDDLSDLEHQNNFDHGQINAELGRLGELIAQNSGDLKKYATLKYVDSLNNKRIESDSILADSLSQKINGALKRIDILDTLAHNNYNRFLQVQGKVESLKVTVDSLAARLDTLIEPQIKVLRHDVDSIFKDMVSMNLKLNTVNMRVDSVNWRVDSVEVRLDTIEKKVEILDLRVDKLTERMQKLITGILIQSTDNPIFGNFSMPIGVQSNLLFNWYGKNLATIPNFPNASATYTYNNEASALTAADLAYLGITPEAINEGYFDDEVSLGTVYMTVNPVGHDFTDTGLTIENSIEEALPYDLKIKKSNKKLTFGYTRASEIGNGFYEAEVVMPANAEAIAATEVTIDTQLASSMKNTLKDPSMRNAASLMKALYNQMSGKLTAYALRYDWKATNVDSLGNETEDSYAVLSKYDLAVATARPLSYSALKGVGSDKKMPTIGHIDNFIATLKEKALNKFVVDAYISVDGNRASVKDINFETKDGKLIAIVEGMVVNGTTLPDFEVTCRSVELAVEDVNKAIVEKFMDAVGNHTDSFKAESELKLDAVLLQMNNQINEVVDQIKGSISDMFDSAESSTDSYFDRVNKAFELYNKVANKINTFLANPQAYLQVAAFYMGSNNVGLLSQKLSDPTPFAKGGKAINIYLSSYTGDIVAPAYKKFFALTNVYKNGKEDAAEKANAKSINSAEGLNTVLEGSKIKVQIPAESLKSGYVYEFVYQGVDYSGYTSAKKFYITVN